VLGHVSAYAWYLAVISVATWAKAATTQTISVSDVVQKHHVSAGMVEIPQLLLP
jgi:hypothetical protein